MQSRPKIKKQKGKVHHNNFFIKTMKDYQNEFYTSISDYYADIFPYQPVQLQFVKKELGSMLDKNILDIGCATGELAVNMAFEGARVTGIDLNSDLINKAKSEKHHPNLRFQTGNMLELENNFLPAEFDAVLCFGNTLVHLQSLDLMLQMMKGVYSVLKPGGQFLLQILNYDYIINQQIFELPLIETDRIRFKRSYKRQEGSQQIRFITQLEIKRENRNVSNETILFSLSSMQLVKLLETSGFKEIELFSNFKRESFGGAHLPLVLRCNK